jgi:hypothetical protein
MPEYSISPTGEKFQLPGPEDYLKEFEGLKETVTKQRILGREIVVVMGLGFVGAVNLDPDEVVKNAGGPIAVIDCFGILDDEKIRRYFELGCEVKGLGRGHVKRIKDQVRDRKEQLLPDISMKNDKSESRLSSEHLEVLNGGWKITSED